MGVSLNTGRGARLPVAKFALDTSGNAAGQVDPAGNLILYPESTGTKLRRLADRERARSVSPNVPMLLPSAWQVSTAYVRGNVVSNGGNWYVCVTPGTSAGSGGPTSSAVNLISDNTAQWAYLGSPTITANDPLAPTITTSGSSVPGSLTNLYDCVNFSSVFRRRGCYTQAFATSYWNLFTLDYKSGVTVPGANVAVEFMTDAPIFAIAQTNNDPRCNVRIDGRLVALDGPARAANSPNWSIYDFSAVGGRRTRRVTVEYCNAWATNTQRFGGVRVGPNDQVWSPPAAQAKAVFCADSILSGTSTYGPMLFGSSVATNVGRALGWDDVWDMSIGGTGYVATSGGNAYYTFAQRIPQIVAQNPDIVVFMGSTNDFGQSGVTAAVTATLRGLRDAGYAGPIVVAGVIPVSAEAATTEAQVAAGVAAFVDPRRSTYWIPVASDPLFPWITGAWNNTLNTQSTNATLLISPDTIHPMDYGTEYLSRRLARAIDQQVLSALY